MRFAALAFLIAGLLASQTAAAVEFKNCNADTALAAPKVDMTATLKRDADVVVMASFQAAEGCPFHFGTMSMLEGDDAGDDRYGDHGSAIVTTTSDGLVRVDYAVWLTELSNVSGADGRIEANLRSTTFDGRLLIAPGASAAAPHANYTVEFSTDVQ